MTDPTASSDLPSENGKRPPAGVPGENPPLGGIGTGDGYSGEEYDSKGQARWRAEQARLAVPADGEVRGSGAGAGGGNPGEDFDSDAATGDGSEGVGG